MKHIYTLIIFISTSLFASAQWSTDTVNNLKVANVNCSDIVTVADALHPSNSIWIAFYSYNQATANYDMRVQLLDHEGNKKFGDSGLVISTKNSGTATFVFNACLGDSNNLYVAFQYQKNNDYECIIQKVMPDGTLPWGNGIDLGTGLSPYPAALSNGQVVVAWNNNGVINYQKLFADGRKAWSTAKEIQSSRGRSVTRAQVVAHTNGTFGILYQDLFYFPVYTNLFMQRFDDKGNGLWNTAKQISTLTTSAARYYDVHGDADTTYVGYYGNPFGVNRFNAYVQRVNPDSMLPFGNDGASFADYTTGTQPSEQTINIAHLPRDVNLYAACTFTNPDQTESGIYFQKFNALTGERLLGNLAKEIFPLSANLTTLTGSGITQCYGDNPVNLTFTDATNKLYATALDASGNFVWPDPVVTLCSTTNQKSRFGFVFNFTGIPEDAEGSIAVWQENKGDGDKPYAQDVSCSGITGILPVSLLNFQGNKSGTDINLYWQTANEANNKGFYIERSSNSQNFSTIGFVASKALKAYSASLLSYNFTDKSPLPQNYYRLKQVDVDGKTSYSKILKIGNNANSLIAGEVYPNPVHNQLYIKAFVPSAEQIKIIIIDAAGRLVKQENKMFITGSDLIPVDVSSLKQGVYFIKLEGTISIENNMQRFVIQR